MPHVERTERLIAQAAHDLQEPLRVLSGYLDLLVMKLDGEVADLDAPALAHDARDTAERMQRIMRSVLEYAEYTGRAPRGPVKADGDQRDVALADAVDEALRNLELRVQETGATIRVGALPTLRAAPTPLVRVFQNLIENSLKYAARDGRPPQVAISSVEQAGSWTILVDDDGPGWPDVERDRLFEPFVRFRRDVAPGAGLGLAMVRGIVERMGGRVRATEAPGGGARVEITFPRSA